MRKSLNKLADSARQMLHPLAARGDTNQNTAPESEALKKAKQNIYWQAALALMTIVLTLVIIFTMTAAWYTNIVQTNGLLIRAESWGFDGDIKVNSTAITAAPGDEGLIHLEIKSKSNSLSAVSVGASKARLADADEMGKRLYFYVDTQMVRNGETMERVYLNSLDSYTYTVFGQGELTLTEKVHNGPQLKWQWVYDVLGYYVLGSWSEERQSVSGEYLRPIEYNYDEATTTFDAETNTMELKTVDGKTSPEDFLVEFSETDGYEGQIKPEDKRGSYYPVDVDESGYGVYAYLCNYAEIELASDYDTKLAQEAANLQGDQEPKTYEMQLRISAQKNDENVVYAGTVEGLKTAIEMNHGGTVRLTDDIVITESVTLPTGSQLMLDLDGHTITSEVDGRTFDVGNGGKLTLLNGEIVGDNKGYAVFSVGAEVVCSDMTISNFVYGLCLADYMTGNTMDSRVRLVNCEVSGNTAALYVGGNGAMSAMKSQMIIEGGKLTGGTYALVGSGNTDAYGTDIQIIGSEVTGGYAAIYHPQKDSTLSVYGGSTLSGYTGIAIKGGTVAVYDSTVSGTGGEPEEPEFVGSGFSDTGAAVYVETGYGYDISVEIHGTSTLTSNKGVSLQVYQADAPHANVTVYGGTFNHEIPARYLHSGSTQQQENAGWTVTAQG